MLTNDEQLVSTPLIMLTGSCDEKTIRRCHEMCAYYVLKSDNVWQRMEPVICDVLGIKSLETDRPQVAPTTGGKCHTSPVARGELRRLVDFISRETSGTKVAEEDEHAHMATAGKSDFPVG